MGVVRRPACVLHPRDIANWDRPADLLCRVFSLQLVYSILKWCNNSGTHPLGEAHPAGNPAHAIEHPACRTEERHMFPRPNKSHRGSKPTEKKGQSLDLLASPAYPLLRWWSGVNVCRAATTAEQPETHGAGEQRQSADSKPNPPNSNWQTK